MTALVALTVSMLIGLFLMWGGKIAIVLMILLVGFMLYKSGRIHTKRKSREQQQQQVLSWLELVTSCNEEVRLMLTNPRYTNGASRVGDEDRKG